MGHNTRESSKLNWLKGFELQQVENYSYSHTLNDSMCTKPVLKYWFFFFLCNRKSFRSAFEKLDFLTSLFAKTPIIGLTATATKLIQQKIVESLGLITPIVIDVNPDRKNIHFSTLCRGNQGGERLVNILDPLLKDLRDKRLTIIYGNLETITNCFFYFTSKFGIEQYEPVGAP